MATTQPRRIHHAGVRARRNSAVEAHCGDEVTGCHPARQSAASLSPSPASRRRTPGARAPRGARDSGRQAGRGAQLGGVLGGRTEERDEVEARVVERLRPCRPERRRTTPKRGLGAERAGRVDDGLGEVGLEPVGELLDLVGAQVGEVRAHLLGVGVDVPVEGPPDGRAGGRLRGGRRAHQAATSPVRSSADTVPANVCHSLRCRSSMARPCGLIP